MIDDRTATRPKTTSLKAYKKMKLKMLERDLCVHPEPEEIEHLNSLQSEVAVDQCVFSLLDKHWNKKKYWNEKGK